MRNPRIALAFSTLRTRSGRNPTLAVAAYAVACECLHLPARLEIGMGEQVVCGLGA